MRLLIILCTLVATVLPSGAATQQSGPAGQAAESPLYVAIRAGDVGALQRLLQAGADPNASIPFGEGGPQTSTPLGLALSVRPEALTDVVRVFVAGGADPNGVFGRPGDEATPLMAAYDVPPEVVGLLLDAGADPNIGSCDPYSGGVIPPLGVAERAGDEVAELLRQAGASVSSAEFGYSQSPAEAALHTAVYRGDTAAVERLLRSGSDPNAAITGPGVRKGEMERYSPLGVALFWRFLAHHYGIEPTPPAEPDHREVVRLLLGAGADPNASAELGGVRFTPLSADRMEVAALLRTAGAEETGSYRGSAIPHAFEEASAACTRGAGLGSALAEPVTAY